jgi:hypothetical protein
MRRIDWRAPVMIAWIVFVYCAFMAQYVPYARTIGHFLKKALGN